MFADYQILIAEDNPALARVLSFKFKSCGFETIICGDGQTAWEIFQSDRVDAVISDQEMPGLTGVELCRRIRSVDDYLPFVLVTGRQLELSSDVITDDLHVTEVFAKPFSPNAVVESVRRAIQSAAVVG